MVDVFYDFNTLNEKMVTSERIIKWCRQQPMFQDIKDDNWLYFGSKYNSPLITLSKSYMYPIKIGISQLYDMNTIELCIQAIFNFNYIPYNDDHFKNDTIKIIEPASKFFDKFILFFNRAMNILNIEDITDKNIMARIEMFLKNIKTEIMLNKLNG